MEVAVCEAGRRMEAEERKIMAEGFELKKGGSGLMKITAKWPLWWWVTILFLIFLILCYIVDVSYVIEACECELGFGSVRFYSEQEVDGGW